MPFSSSFPLLACPGRLIFKFFIEEQQLAMSRPFGLEFVGLVPLPTPGLFVFKDGSVILSNSPTPQERFGPSRSGATLSPFARCSPFSRPGRAPVRMSFLTSHAVRLPCFCRCRARYLCVTSFAAVDLGSHVPLPLNLKVQSLWTVYCG